MYCLLYILHNELLILFNKTSAEYLKFLNILNVTVWLLFTVYVPIPPITPVSCVTILVFAITPTASITVPLIKVPSIIEVTVRTVVVILPINFTLLTKTVLVGTLENLIYSGYLLVDGKKESKPLDTKTLNPIDWVEINGIEDTQKPPTRYNDASLINKMDPKNLNIGRPSTYASFIEKIKKKR